MVTLQRVKCKSRRCRYLTLRSAAQAPLRIQSVPLPHALTLTHTKLRHGKSRVPLDLCKTRRLHLLRRMTSTSIHQTARTLEIELAALAAQEATAAPLLDDKVINLSLARWVSRVEQVAFPKRNVYFRHLVAFLCSDSLAL